MAWNPAVIQGADVLVVRGGKPLVITASAPVPWPGHLNPGAQKWRMLQGPKGEKLWYGDQGGLVWGEMTPQIANEILTLEERTIPTDPKAGPFDDVDQLARVLRQGEDVTQTSIQRFYPGIIGLAPSGMDEEVI